MKIDHDFYREINIAPLFINYFLVSIVVLSSAIMPVYWGDNEIHYFDLSYRMVRPDLFGDNHSVFDSSNARFLIYWFIGTIIDQIGFEYAKVILGIFCILMYAVVLAFLAKELRLGVPALAVALFVFLGHQSLLGSEWVFRTTEAKVFAYAVSIAAIALSLRGLWTVAIVASALGTVFHFLVGGFWGAAIIILHVLVTGDWRKTLKYSALFMLLISPMVVLLGSERLGAEVDLQGIDASLASIYAEYRNAHHVAPFAGGINYFATGFFPGLVGHAGLALAFFLMRGDFGEKSPIVLWVVGLNAYIVVAIAVAFLDRDTHFLAPLYMLRPSGLILLLSLLLIALRIVLAISPNVLQRISLPVLVIVAGFVLPEIALKAARIVVAGPIDRRIEARMDDAQRDVLRWLRANTREGSVVLIEPASGDGNLSEGAAFPSALERLTPAAYYVNFKSVPTAPSDLAIWYRRLQERRSIFDGDCALIAKLPITYLVARRSTGLAKFLDCASEVRRNPQYVIYVVNIQ